MSTDHLSPRRVGNIGSSMIAGLFGRSNWMTELMLYAHFVDGYDIDKDPEERMDWGKLLQDYILHMAAKQSGWEIEPNADDSWVQHPDEQYRGGSTVDAWVRRHEWGLGVIECKNVDWLRWRDQGWTDQAAPPMYELQLQHQLWSTGAAWGCFAVLVGGNDLHMIPSEGGIIGRRLPLSDVHRSIEAKLLDFWRRVDLGKRAQEDPSVTPDPPPTIGHPLDIGALAHLYPEPVEDPPLDLMEDAAFAQLVADYQWAKDRVKDIGKLEEEAKVKLLAAMMGAGRARTRGAWVTIKRPFVKGGTYTRKDGRQTRITIKPVAGEEQVEMEGFD